MTGLETALRFLTIGQLGLLALIMGASWRHGRAIRHGTFLCLCVIGYLCMSSPVLRLSSSAPAGFAVATFFSTAAPFSIWAFALSLFEENKPLPRVPLVIFVLTFLTQWSAAFVLKPVHPIWFSFIDTAFHLISITALCYAIFIAVAGLQDDLAEPRRRFRAVFIFLTSVQAITVTGSEFWLGFDRAVEQVGLYNSFVISGLTIGFSMSFLGLRHGLFETRTRKRLPRAALPPPEEILYQRLKTYMEDGGFKESGLTITGLATYLQVPEYRLRKLINQHLGFRNFSAYINGYRLAQAKQQLADEKCAHIPILTIAMDLGYGSIGPFNRAFKDATQLTPKEYRQAAQRIDQNRKNNADFEIDQIISKTGQTD